MSEIGGGQSRTEQKYASETLALGLALEDALSDLVQVHGIGYLDTFLERRLRRTVNEMRRHIGIVDSPGITQLQVQGADDAEAALRQVVENVRRDPTPVT